MQFNHLPEQKKSIKTNKGFNIFLSNVASCNYIGKDNLDQITLLGEIFLGKRLASEAQLETITVLKNSAKCYLCMHVALFAFVCVLAVILRHCLKGNFTPCALLTVIATWY